MSTLDSFVSEVEQAIASGDLERRAKSLRQLTELFMGQASNLNDAHVSVFDEVILRLARDVEQGARVELSSRLARVANAPKKIVRDLAGDSHAAVAQPVLERSPQLSEDDLMEFAAQKTQDHLLAISRRRMLSERLTDLLVDRGDARVVHAVAENSGARLSEQGLTKLLAKAQGDDDLRGVLQKRPDIADVCLRVVAQSAPQKQPAPNLKPEATVEARRMEAALAKLAGAMIGPSEPSGRDILPALERLARTAKDKGVEEVRVANWIKAEKIDDALAAVAHNAGLPAATIVRAFEAAAYEPLLLVVRAARYSWNTFKLLLTSRDGKVPPADVLKTSFESFQQFSVANAQQLGLLMSGRESVKAAA